MGLALKSLFSPSPLKERAQALYLAAVEQARQPFLYEGYGVPDTLDGRFDAIALHIFLLMRRLKAEESPEAQTLSRYLSEAFLADMDRSIREMGVGDTGVGRRVKAMASAFLGRMQAYEAAAADETQWSEALARNVYRGTEKASLHARPLAQYALGCAAALAAQPPADILAGRAQFLS